MGSHYIWFCCVQFAKRCLVLVVASALLFILLQPPIPLSWTYHSDLIKAAHQTGHFDLWLYDIKAYMAFLAPYRGYLAHARCSYFIHPYQVHCWVENVLFHCCWRWVSTSLLSTSLRLWSCLIVLTMICTSVFVVFTHFPFASTTLEFAVDLCSSCCTLSSYLLTREPG